MKPLPELVLGLLAKSFLKDGLTALLEWKEIRALRQRKKGLPKGVKKSDICTGIGELLGSHRALAPVRHGLARRKSLIQQALDQSGQAHGIAQAQKTRRDLGVKDRLGAHLSDLRQETKIVHPGVNNDIAIVECLDQCAGCTFRLRIDDNTDTAAIRELNPHEFGLEARFGVKLGIEGESPLKLLDMSPHSLGSGEYGDGGGHGWCVTSLPGPAGSPKAAVAGRHATHALLGHRPLLRMASDNLQ